MTRKQIFGDPAEMGSDADVEKELAQVEAEIAAMDQQDKEVVR